MAVPLRRAITRRVGDDLRHSLYRTWAPDPSVAVAVQCSWLGVPGWARTIRLLPDGCVDIVWDGTTLAVVAVGTAPGVFEVPRSGQRVGVRLRCGAAGGLLGGAVADLPPEPVPLAALAGPGSDEVNRVRDRLAGSTTPEHRRALLLGVVVALLRQGRAADPTALAAVRLLSVPAARVELVGERLGISQRSLRRLVTSAVGMSPKELHRVRRFRRFAERLPAIAAGRSTLATTAALLGYADQSHLGRECRRLSGSSPARLIESWRGPCDVAEIFQTGRGRPGQDLRHEPPGRT